MEHTGSIEAEESTHELQAQSLLKRRCLTHHEMYSR